MAECKSRRCEERVGELESRLATKEPVRPKVGKENTVQGGELAAALKYGRGCWSWSG